MRRFFIESARRHVAALLAACMLVSLLPQTALAQESPAAPAAQVTAAAETPQPETPSGGNEGETPSGGDTAAPGGNEGETPSGSDTAAPGSGEPQTPDSPENTAPGAGAQLSPEDEEGGAPEEGILPAALPVPNEDGSYTVTTPQELAALSQIGDTANLEININTTGVFDLSGTDYQGLGTPETPFRGRLRSQSAGTLQIKTGVPLFRGLSSQATLTGFTVTWVGGGESPMLAETYELADDAVFPVSIGIDSEARSAGPLVGTLRLAEGTGAGTLTLGGQVTYGAGDITLTGSENAGLLCRTIQSGTLQLAEGFTLPAGAVSVTGGANAGGLVGEMGAGAALLTAFTGDKTYANLTVTGGENAGGLVGLAAAGARLRRAESQPGKLLLAAPTVAGSKPAANVGGLMGGYTAAESQNLPDCVGLAAPAGYHVKLKNGANSHTQGYMGGLFGQLTLAGEGETVTLTVNGADGWYDGDTFTAWSVNKSFAWGGLIGRVCSQNLSNTLEIKNLSIRPATKAADGDAFAPRYFGGLIGLAGDGGTGVYVKLGEKDAPLQVKAVNPYVAAITADTAGFGGAIGRLEKGSAAALAGLALTTEAAAIDGGKATNDPEIWRGGGAVGEAAEGSVVCLSGLTDMSGVRYQSAYGVGQLVGWQDRALVYALGSGNAGDTGWEYRRGQICRYNRQLDINSGANDIGSYGQVYRLHSAGLSPGLLTLDAVTHQVTFGSTVAFSGGNLQLADKDRLAILAIAMQSQGVFSGVEGITAANYTELYRANITLTGDIDLRGTGVMGLTRDNTKETAYSGTLDGGGHTLRLAIGEKYGVENSGYVYGNGALAGFGYSIAHNAAGLFGKLSGTVKNLKLQGTLRGLAANDRGYGAGLFGLLAGEVSGAVTLEQVEADAGLTVDCKAGIATATAYIACGLLARGNRANLTLKGVRTAGTLTLDTVTPAGAHAGGVLGLMSGGTLDCEDVTLAGALTASAGGQAMLGGLAATVQNAAVTLRGVTAQGLTIRAGSAGSAGGLLGYCWQNTAVTFTPTATGYGFAAKNASVAAGKGSLGGLVYAAGGKWTVPERGIDLSGAGFTAKNDLGLLVCHGESKNDNTLQLNGGNANMQGLYLELTAHWDSAYRVPATVSAVSGHFDELVAYTAASAAAITGNNANGVISLATQTQGGHRLGVNVAARTTYVNRSSIKKVNDTSRYYYDLDAAITKVEAGAINNGWLDTPQELLLWSVRRYAAGGIKQYFPGGDCAAASPKIGGESGSVTLDLQGLSYYPVDLTGGAAVQNAVITFRNREIQDWEGDNKPLLARTQHYLMHGSLFLNGTVPNAAVTVTDTTLRGSVGLAEGASGALFRGTLQGGKNGDTIATARLTVQGLTLDGLYVNGAGADSYAPLLINRVGSYTHLSFGEAKESGSQKGVSYIGTVANAASSLLGEVGSATGSYVNLEFAGMNLPAEGGVFTRATLLESYRYAPDGTSAGRYLFYKSDEPSTSAGTTYGSEITDSAEYPEQQLWYYDELGYGTDANRVPAGTEVLPYVYRGYAPAQQAHELVVNQRAADLTKGCGTYGHPYAITMARELEDLALYIATGNPKLDWKVRITADPDTLHTDTDAAADIVLIAARGNTWRQCTAEGKPDENKPGISNEFMREYLRSAYFDVQSSVTLEDFAGLGTDNMPFRGVLVSTKGAAVTLTGSKTGSGLIAYSYGSVVRNLTLHYGKAGENKTLTYAAHGAYYPDVCFGGVMGCVLGGDNIIENVAVTVEPGWLTLSGEKSYLLQVGGYVGSVCGGGVLFRGVNSTGEAMSALKGDASDNRYYVNPYVGRVLNGYAFSEVCVLHNGKDFPILNIKSFQNTQVTLTAGSDGVTAAIPGAESLLLLAALINSGGAGGGQSWAYGGPERTFTLSLGDGAGEKTYRFGGAYGKVRSAAYSGIGTSAAEDFAKAWADDRQAPGIANAPYLAAQYCGRECFGLLSSEKITFTFPNSGSMDLSVYGNAWQGISARYGSNAVRGGDANAWGVIPRVVGLAGNGSTLKVSRQVREYADDDFPSEAVGGLFNRLILGQSTTAVTGLTLAESTLELLYPTPAAAPPATGVGGLAGVMSNAGGAARTAACSGITLRDTQITGPYAAGGLLGRTVLAKKAADLSLTDCTYTGLTLTGGQYAGGYAGELRGGAVNGVNTTFDSLPLGSASTIKVDGPAGAPNGLAGGLFGLAAASVKVGPEEEGKTLVLQDVQVLSTRAQKPTDDNSYGVGGIAGKAQNTLEVRRCRLENMTLTGGAENDTLASGQYVRAGGLASYTVKSVLAEDCTLSCLRASGVNAGGLVGKGEQGFTVRRCTVSGTGAKRTLIAGAYGAGGLVGVTSSGNYTLAVYDSVIENADIQSVGTPEGTKKDKAKAAGVVNAAIHVKASNLRLSGVHVRSDSSMNSFAGLLAVFPFGTPGRYASFAGVSIRNSRAEEKVKLVNGVYQGTEVTDLTPLWPAGRCYVALCDYADTREQPNTDKPLLDIGAAVQQTAPYAVTSPVSGLRVSDGGTVKYLYGDGIVWDEAKKLTAQSIIAAPQANGAYYKNIPADAGATVLPQLSTYNEQQKGREFPTDIPVLTCFGSTAHQVITAYLDTVTNGGFSQANAFSGSRPVQAEAAAYRYDEGSDSFVKSTEAASLACTEKEGRLHFEGNGLQYDNGRGRLTLLTVTFTAGDRACRVYVPVIVQRKLEIDFYATLTHGTNFLPENYAQLTNHVLDSTGNPITGYLSFVYNSKQGAYVDYGWQDVLTSGVDLAKPFERAVTFSSGLPAGTQFTLIDLQSAAPTAYYYTAPAETKKLSLSAFTGYTQRGLSQVLGVTAAADAAGPFVLTEGNDALVQAQIDGQWKGFRLAAAGEEGPRYTLTVPTLHTQDGEQQRSTVRESFFLVITVPNDASGQGQNDRNGYITADFTGIPVEYAVTDLRRFNGSPDTHSGTESTYLISSGYRQTLQETLPTGTASTCEIRAGFSEVLQIRLRDTITVPSGQAFNSSDQLYLRFTASLQHIKENGSAAAAVIPNGTTGTVRFYIHTQDGTYYTLSPSSGKLVSAGKTRQTAVSYDCAASGSTLELLLSSDGTRENAISLQPVRLAVETPAGQTPKSFFVEAELDAKLPTDALDVIPKADLKNGALSEYARLSYLSRISVEKSGLSYSDMTASLSETQVGYYRKNSEDAQLKFNAKDLSQLGINLRDLMDEHLSTDAQGRRSRIDAFAEYDLRGVRDWQELLKDSQYMRFTLELQRKTGDTAYEKEAHAGAFLQVEGKTYQAASNSWSWEVPRVQYYDDTASAPKLDGMLAQALTLQVRLDGIEEHSRFFANYRVLMTAEVVDTEGKSQCVVKDALIYTLAQIKPEFVKHG